MCKSLIFLGFAIALTPSSAFAQLNASGIPSGPGGARADSVGTTSDPMKDYLHQKQLNNLPEQGANTSAAGSARPAKPEELTAGAVINDKHGVAIAKIEQVDADGVVVSTGLSKVKVPTEAFGHNKAGLLLDMTKAQFEQVVAQANTAH